jgi:hypothetical protein
MQSKNGNRMRLYRKDVNSNHNKQAPFTWSIDAWNISYPEVRMIIIIVTYSIQLNVKAKNTNKCCSLYWRFWLQLQGKAFFGVVFFFRVQTDQEEYSCHVLHPYSCYTLPDQSGHERNIPRRKTPFLVTAIKIFSKGCNTYSYFWLLHSIEWNMLLLLLSFWLQGSLCFMHQ